MSEIKPQPVLMFGSDQTFFDVGSDTFSRMEEYAHIYGSVYILVPTRDPEKESVRSGLVRVYPAYGYTKIEQVLRLYKRGAALLKEKGICSIIAQDPFVFGFLAWILSRKYRIPFVVGIYGTDIFNRYMRTESVSRRIYSLIARFILPRATAIQTDGPETIGPLRKNYGDKVFFKPMFPANLSGLKNSKRDIGRSPLKVLFVGRFVSQKNIPLLINVIEETYKKAGGNILFTLIGTGPQYAWCSEELKKRGLLSVCELRGVVPREEVPKVFASHHVLLMTSRYEGFPRVFMESAVAGVPIVTAEVGGIQDIVLDGMTGVVMKQDTDPSVWADKLVELSKHEERLQNYSQNIRDAFERAYGGKTLLDYQRPLAEFVARHI